jgi:hypothetical protein
MAFEAGGLGALGVGGGAFPSSEDNLLTSGASASIADQATIQQRAAQIIQSLIAQKTGGAGSGIAFGAQPPSGPRLPQPPQQVGGPGIPQGSFGSSGEARRADKQALFGTIANIVQGAEKRHYDMKVDKIKADFEMLTNAIQGYHEAQTSGNQSAMEHNAKLINSIVMDPKKSKELAKAFEVDINPLAEKKKKEKPNPAHDALKAAFAKDTQDFAAKKTPLTPQAQAFMRAMPQRQGVDPRLAIIEQLTKSGVLPKAGEELTFQKDLMQIAERAQANKLTNDDKMSMAKMMVDAKDRATQASLQRVLMTVQGANDRMEIMERMWRYRADQTLKGVQERVAELKARVSKKQDTASDKQLNTLVNSLDKQSKTLKDEIEAAAKAHNTDQLKVLNSKLQSLQMMQQLASAEAAKRVGLNPEDFNQDPLSLNDEEMKSMLGLFQSAEGDTSGGEPNQQ